MKYYTTIGNFFSMVYFALQSDFHGTFLSPEPLGTFHHFFNFFYQFRLSTQTEPIAVKYLCIYFFKSSAIIRRDTRHIGNMYIVHITFSRRNYRRPIRIRIVLNLGRVTKTCS